MQEILQDKLRVLASDDLMLKAINGIITERIEKEKPTVGISDDDLLLGQRFRAYDKAKDILRLAILDIEAFDTKKHKQITINKGK